MLKKIGKWLNRLFYKRRRYGWDDDNPFLIF